jgi:hypothetical protein
MDPSSTPPKAHHSSGGGGGGCGATIVTGPRVPIAGIVAALVLLLILAACFPAVR